MRRHPELELLDARTALDTVALDDLRLDEAELIANAQQWATRIQQGA